MGLSYALITDFLQDRQSFKFFIQQRHQTAYSINQYRLAHIQQQHEELEQQNKRNRSQKMPSRRAQKTVIKERNLNPVLDLEMSV